MYCKKCGNEIKDGESFCSKCGNKIENSTSNEYKSNEEDLSSEYKSRLAEANNAAMLFLTKKEHTVADYNQVCNAFGRVEMIGAHINLTYINFMDFFIKANLLDDGVFFNYISEIETRYDNFFKLMILNTKDENEKKELSIKYDKNKYLDKFKEKLEIKKKNQKEIRKKQLKPLKYSCIIIGIIILILTIISNISKPNSTTSSSSTSSYEKIKYGSTKYENPEYGSKVVTAFYKKYGNYSTIGVGKITSITKSEFLDKDNYGRYAFKVTFKYNPTNGEGSTMLDRESTKTVIAIYILNLDNPNGLYVGIQNIILTSTNWNDIKTWDNVCGGAWNTPVDLIFDD